MNKQLWFDSYCDTFNGIFIEYIEVNYNENLKRLVTLFEEIQVKEYSYACEQLLTIHLARLRKECEKIAKDIGTLYSNKANMQEKDYYYQFLTKGYYQVIRVYLEAYAIKDNWGFFLQSKEQLAKVAQ